MLTDAGIKALKPKDKLYKVADRDGMYVVVQPSGSIVFRYDYRMNGRRETLTLGRAVGLGLRLWLVGLLIWAVGHFAAVWAAKRDPLFVEVGRRHLRIPGHLSV